MNLDEYLNIKDITCRVTNIMCGFDCKRKYRNRKLKKYHYKGILEDLPILCIPVAHIGIRTLKRMIEREKVSKKWNFFLITTTI